MKNRALVLVVLTALLLGGLSVPRPAQASPDYCHTVRPGETLSQIASRYGVSVQAIMAANNLWDPNLIFVGQCLTIPSYGPQPGTKPYPGCYVVHIVKRGEYLKLIAARYGVRWQAIAEASGLRNPNLIYVGQRLIIPKACKPVQPTPVCPWPPCPPPTPVCPWPPCPTPPTPVPVTGPWLNQFWNNRYFTGAPQLTRYSNTIYYDWGLAGPGNKINGASFSARFNRTRYLDAGLYQFRVQVDDGVRFWLDGVLLIDQWNDGGLVREFSVQRQVGAGQHQLQLDYYQNGGCATIRFYVEPISPPAVWHAEFFNSIDLSGAPVYVRDDSAINFNWGYGSPAPGVTADYFSVRWTGKFSFVEGKYRFTATMDDGMRIYLDDQLIIDAWRLNPTTTIQVDVDVSGGEHTVKVEHFENNGTAVAKVSWAKR